jgi:hypothetical protein
MVTVPVARSMSVQRSAQIHRPITQRAAETRQVDGLIQYNLIGFFRSSASRARWPASGPLSMNQPISEREGVGPASYSA